MIVNCKNCGKEFDKIASQVKRSPNHFCSRSCAITVNNTKKRSRIKPFQSTVNKYSKCSICGVNLNYKNRRSRCKKCLMPDYTLAEIQYDQHNKSSAWALVRSRARSTIKHLPKVCSKCGYDKHVECCHIKPISEFPLSTKISEVNSENNLILLCPNCHWEHDNL